PSAKASAQCKAETLEKRKQMSHDSRRPTRSSGRTRGMGSPLSGSNSPFNATPAAAGATAHRGGVGGKRNQSRQPQAGWGASPGGRGGSRRRWSPETGQRFASPSGVREETVMAYTEKPLPANVKLTCRGHR